MLGIFRKIIVVALSAFVMVACTDNDPFLSFSDESVNVSFTATLNNGNHGARSGEETPAPDVTHLRYQVFTSTMQPGTINETFEPTAVSGELAINGGQANINVDFVKNQSYRIVFIAYNQEKSQSGNYPYTISDDMSSMSVDYTKATAGHELFYAVTGTLQVDASGNIPESARTVVLTRPFATIALCTDDETEEYVSESVNVTFTESLYTNLNLTTGFATAECAVYSLTAAVNKESESSMTVNNKAVYKFASFNVLTDLNGSENTMSFALEADGVEKTGIPVTLTRNYLVKVAGDVVEVDECKMHEGENGWLHISTKEQLIEFLTTKSSETKIHICNDIDMTGVSLNSVAGLNEETEIDGLISVKENGVRVQRSVVIKNLQLDDVHGIFGEVANNLKINNLEIGGVTLNSNSANNVGVLLGKATGSLEMTNVTVDGCTVNGSRNVGGMVGYIDGNASFAGCVSKNVTTNAAGDPATPTVSEYKTTGAMVGVFKGNTAEELLTFDADCSVEGYTTGAGAYVAQNQSCWVADGTEEWSGTPDMKYDNALGNEEFCRGTVNYGAVRIVPHWDGIRRVAPITESGVILINSPFDLANLQRKDDNNDNTTYASVKFVTDVDMASEIYEPIYKITNLDGNYKTLYGLKVDTKHRAIGGDSYGGGLMRITGGGTHQNFTIMDAEVRVLHEESSGNAYAGILSASVSSSHTIQNVHIKNSYLYAVCKMGGLVGRVNGGTFNCIGCTVDNCEIENYNPGIKDEFVGELLWFYTCGEVGGLIGMILTDANVKYCAVTNTTINCIGCDDKRLVILYEVPGRPVNQFIGAIRTINGNKITIEEYTLSNNSMKNRNDIYQYRKKSGSRYTTYTVEMMGYAYAIVLPDYAIKLAESIGLSWENDKEGEVEVNGQSVPIHTQKNNGDF